MPEEVINVCGTGGYSGPLPGDPDNNITLSATAVFGGVSVSWTEPLTNPEAVAFYRLYRGLTNNPAGAVFLTTWGGTQYLDQSPEGAPPRYYYWLEVLSVHGTVGAWIGPATAIANDTIADMIERLTGLIDEGVLATSLRDEIARIETLNNNLVAEVATRLNDDGVLAGIVADAQDEVATALTYIYNETQSRIDGDAAALDSYNVLAASVGGSLAALVEEINLVAEAGLATAGSLSALEASVNSVTTGLATKASVSQVATAKAEAIAASAVVTDTISAQLTNVRKWENQTNVNGNDAALIVDTLKESDGTTALKNGDQLAEGVSKGTISYTVSARVPATGSATGATSVFTCTWDGTAWVWTHAVMYEAGTVSNHVRLYLNGGVPSVRLYNHTVTYPVRYSVEVNISSHNALSAVQTETTARISADAALASQITTAQSTLNGNIASAQTTLQTNINTVDGKVVDIGALYTAKVSVNGLVGGFGVYNDGTEVQAGFDLDTFWVGRTGPDKVKPFIVTGEVVYMDNAMINQLTADKIDSRGLSIKDVLGNVIFSAGVPLNWENVGGAGKPADGATRNVFRGPWTTDTLYAIGDLVIEAGYGWAAVAVHTSSAVLRPPIYPESSNTNWTLYTVKGDTGLPGANGTRTAILDMYRNSAAEPTTFPSGNSTYTWTTGQFTAPATPNSWSLTPPAPVAGQDLWVVRQLYSDNNTSVTSLVGWAATTARISAASGEPGADGINGSRTAFLEVYKWTTSTPTLFPAGSSTYTWATGAFTAPATPNGWSVVPGAQIAGQTLWACSVRLANNTTVPTDSVTWNTNVAYAVGAAGVHGIDGAPGANAVVALLSNEAHVFPASNVGAVLNYASSGTQIRVYEGATELLYDGVGTANSTWKVVSTASNITRGALTDSGSFLTVGQHSGVAAGTDVSSIDYTITGKNAAGQSFIIVKSQSFSKSKIGAAGPTVILTSDRPTTFTSTDGALDGEQTDLVLTASAQSLNSPSFVWSFSGLQTNPAASTTGSQTITAAQFGTSKAAIITCTVNGIYVDKMTIVRLEKSTAAANAASGAVLIKSAGITLVGNKASRLSGSGWTEQVYSRDGYVGGAYAIATPLQNNKATMFGLNSDPTTDASYGSIDYSMYVMSSGALKIYRNLTPGEDIGTYVAGDVLAVTYDGSTMRWLKNGVTLFSQTVAITVPLFFDSSFNESAAHLSGIQFGPYGNPSAVQPSNPITEANVSTFIANAAIGNAQIGGAIYSTGYVAGSAGWIINKDGTAEFNTGTFRGALAAASGTFSGTLTADAINAVNSINIANNAITVSSSATGTDSSVSTNLYVPAGVTARLFAIASKTSGPEQGNILGAYQNLNVTINGNTRSYSTPPVVRSYSVGQIDFNAYLYPPVTGAHEVEVSGPATITASATFGQGGNAITLLFFARFK